MNALHITLAACFSSYLALIAYGRFRARARKWHWTYLRLLLLCSASSIVLTPFVWLICAAFKTPEVLMTYTFLPEWSRLSSETVNLGNFKRLLEPTITPRGEVYFWQYIANSTFLASIQTSIQLLFCSMGGYALAKYDFRSKKLIMGFMLGSMMIPPMILFAPVYRMMVQLGWIDTYWALIVPTSVSAFGMFLFRQASLGVPGDIIESGRIDGCSEFSIYWNLVMPLVRPMSGAFCLIAFLGSWNNFLGPQIYINSTEKLTLPVIITQYVGVYSSEYGVFLAGTLLSIIPPAILFFALQREFIAGLTSGAVKG